MGSPSKDFNVLSDFWFKNIKKGKSGSSEESIENSGEDLDFISDILKGRVYKSGEKHGKKLYRHICKECKTNFYVEDLKLLDIATCPKCGEGSVYAQEHVLN